MRAAVIVIVLLGASCKGDSKVNGWDTDQFKPHRATGYRQTPGGHLRDAGPFGSVAAGFITDQDIDQAVDQAWSTFAAKFPELPAPGSVFVDLTDDYVFYAKGAGWAAGECTGRGAGTVYVCLWSRGTSTVDPGAEWIKRAPDANWAFWRFSALPLAPAIAHELLHTVIDDPQHASPLWGRL